MKKSISNTAAIIAAAIGTVGLAHADNLTVEIAQPTTQQIDMLRDLLAHRMLKRMAVDSWFSVNREVLEMDLELEAKGDAEAHRLVDDLRGICGGEIDIRQVHLLGFSHGTQDV